MSAVKRGVGAVALLAALTGCGSMSGVLDKYTSPAPSSAPAGPSGTADAAPRKDALTDAILGVPKAGETEADRAFREADLPCPEVTVRPGAGTLALGGKGAGGEVNATDLRYQGTLVKFARECKAAAGVMTMKVGIEGRVIIGPAGGPGQVDVPLRLAVVQEGASPKTVVSKFARLAVNVTGEGGSVDFTHIDPDVAFPLPRPLGALENYVVYVGFDPSAAAPKPQAPRRKR
jgi:hypothetical protein